MIKDEEQASLFPEALIATEGTLSKPLDFLRSEHARQKKVCDWIERFIDGIEEEPAPKSAGVLLSYLTMDLALHTLDEEDSLFPMLAERAKPEDGIAAVLARLSSEHELDKDLVDFIAADLKQIASGKRVPLLSRFFANMIGLINTQRRHLTWENEVILPLAEKRLQEQDLEKLSDAMLQRRSFLNKAND